MSRTLLELVQDVLSEMDSDSVNSINDTIEAQQVAYNIRTLYHDIVEEFHIDGKKALFQLDASGTTARPTHMSLPSSIREVFWVMYNAKDSGATNAEWTFMTYLEPEEFLRRTLGRAETDTNVDVITDTSGLSFYIYTDQDPSFYTSFDDSTFVFDSYDSSVDSTLQASKTYCYGFAEPALVIDDATVPDLPDHLQHMLLREAIDYCTAIYKGKDAEKHRRASNLRAAIRNKRNQINNSRDDRPDFGKK